MEATAAVGARSIFQAGAVGFAKLPGDVQAEPGAIVPCGEKRLEDVALGFTVDAGQWRTLQSNGTIAKYEITARSIIVYLRRLEPNKPLIISYRLDAAMPVKITAPPAKAYEYYDPDKQSITQPMQLQVERRV